MMGVYRSKKSDRIATREREERMNDFTIDQLDTILNALIEKRANLVNQRYSLTDRNRLAAELENIEQVIEKVMEALVEENQK
jgi:hypothetical protein